jgi:hypothetical protein
LDFKSLSLRVVRALRGSAIDFKAGGCGLFREIRGDSGGGAARGLAEIDRMF